jgi:hypothetical protein
MVSLKKLKKKIPKWTFSVSEMNETCPPELLFAVIICSIQHVQLATQVLITKNNNKQNKYKLFISYLSNDMFVLPAQLIDLLAG